MNIILEELKAGLLLEHTEFVIESSEVCESESNGDDKNGSTFLKLTGVFQRGDTPNGNKRIYKNELLSREVNSFQSRIVSGLALGKVYHPGYFDHGGPSGVTDVSHRVTKLWMDGDLVKGELLVFRTNSGKDIQAIIEGGGRIGLSSRGYGSMKRFDSVTIKGKTFKDVWLVGDDYKLETFDLVLNPSVKSAIMKPLKENINTTIDPPHETNEEKNIENTEVNIEMTIEELKAKYPGIYNQVREAGISEGRRVGEGDAKDALLKDHTKVLGEKDSEVKILEKEKEALTKNIEELQSQLKELTEKISVFEADKVQGDIKNTVVETINESSLKDHFGSKEIEDICKVVTCVEDAKKEASARIALIEKVIQKNTRTTETGVGAIDTSTTGSSVNEDDANKNRQAFLANQRRAAGL
jgi:phage shock protein A